MKDRISALMDGELDDREATSALEALRPHSEARETWRTYLLIGDTMRETRLLSSGFAARVAARLAEEPTVLAPKPARNPRPFLGERRWQWLSAAASLAAIGFVSVAYFSQEPPSAPAPVADIAAPKQAEIAQVAPPEAASDYLLAHQTYSSRMSLPEVAPYVRMVSTESRGPQQ